MVRTATVRYYSGKPLWLNRQTEVMSVKKRGGRWYFDFQTRGVRYREAIPEALTKFQAEQAETKARDQVFQGTYGTSQLDIKTKTARDRVIPMSQRVREVLIAQRAAQKGDLVFASRRIAKRQAGEGLVDVKKAFVAACQDAGIADFRFHDLCHTFATRLGDAGCNATTIARLLGHSNIQMSMRYTHASDDSLRSAVEHAQMSRVTTGSQTAKQPLTQVAVNS